MGKRGLTDLATFLIRRLNGRHAAARKDEVETPARDARALHHELPALAIDDAAFALALGTWRGKDEKAQRA